MNFSSIAHDASTTRQLEESRILFLGAEVTDAAANDLCRKLLLLDAVDSRRDIHLYINSPGGSVSAGMAVHDTMRLVRPDIVTIALGTAASMGQFLLSSGTAGKRFALPHARIVMHQPHGGFGGTNADVRMHAEQLIAAKRELAELTAAQTGRTVDEIIAEGDRDRWFSAEEAREYGLVDKVVSGLHETQG